MDRNEARTALEALFTAEDNLTKAQQGASAASANVSQAQQNQASAANTHQAAKEKLLAVLGNS